MTSIHYKIFRLILRLTYSVGANLGLIMNNELRKFFTALV
jgi:hypothetical protein